jgi:hypothetical protein
MPKWDPWKWTWATSMPETTRGITTQNSSNWFKIPHRLLFFVGDYPSSSPSVSTGSLIQSVTLSGCSLVLVSASNVEPLEVTAVSAVCLQKMCSNPLPTPIIMFLKFTVDDKTFVDNFKIVHSMHCLDQHSQFITPTKCTLILTCKCDVHKAATCFGASAPSSGSTGYKIKNNRHWRITVCMVPYFAVGYVVTISHRRYRLYLILRKLKQH